MVRHMQRRAAARSGHPEHEAARGGTPGAGSGAPGAVAEPLPVQPAAEVGPNDEGFRAGLAELFREDGWAVQCETGGLWGTRKRPEGEIIGKRKRAEGEATEKGKRPEDETIGKRKRPTDETTEKGKRPGELAKGFKDSVDTMEAALPSFNDLCTWVRNGRDPDDEWDAGARYFLGPTLTKLEAKLLRIKGSLLALQAKTAELENTVSGLAEVVDAVATFRNATAHVGHWHIQNLYAFSIQSGEIVANAVTYPFT